MSEARHPDQPMILDDDGRPRFLQNRVVKFLLSHAQNSGLTLDRLVSMADLGMISQAELRQFYQLIGYSHCGFSELSFIDEESKKRADAAMEAL